MTTESGSGESGQQVGTAPGVSASEVTAHLVVPRARRAAGIVAPFDFALDRELWQLVPDDITLHVTRTPYVDLTVGVDLADVLSGEDAVGEATRSLSVVRPAVTVYLCTSASFVHGLAGEARLREVMESCGAARAVTTSGALLEALDALGARRVAVGTPYDLALTDQLGAFLEEAGLELVRSAYLGLSGNIPQVSAGTVRELALTAYSAETDAVFLACTNLPTIDVLTELEAELGIPVLSANLVSMWSALRSLQALTRDRSELLFQRTADV